MLQTADGEVALKPAAGSEFYGTSLPPDWTSNTWDTGGSATVLGGWLSVDGAMADASATYAPGHWDDVVTVHRLASKIKFLLPGYEGAVQAAICHPFTSAAPRMWHRSDDQGSWVAA